MDTDWSLFESKNVEEHTETGLFYFTFCTGNIIVTKYRQLFPSQDE